MLYRHIRTGVQIDVESTMGGAWQAVKPAGTSEGTEKSTAAKAKTATKTTKTTTKTTTKK